MKNAIQPKCCVEFLNFLHSFLDKTTWEYDYVKPAIKFKHKFEGFLFLINNRIEALQYQRTLTSSQMFKGQSFTSKVEIYLIW